MQLSRPGRTGIHAEAGLSPVADVVIDRPLGFERARSICFRGLDACETWSCTSLFRIWISVARNISDRIRCDGVADSAVLRDVDPLEYALKTRQRVSAPEWYPAASPHCWVSAQAVAVDKLYILNRHTRVQNQSVPKIRLPRSHRVLTYRGAAGCRIEFGCGVSLRSQGPCEGVEPERRRCATPVPTGGSARTRTQRQRICYF